MSLIHAVTRPTLAAMLLVATTSTLAQAPALPPPEATDPITLQLMQGFPPPPDKTVTLPTVLKYPNGRWAYSHMRQLGPTVRLWRGDAGTSSLPTALQPLDTQAFTAPDGKTISLTDWQRNTYTDALLVMHRGKVVYEKYYGSAQASLPHALWSMSKSLTGLLATELIQDGTIDAEAPVSRYLPELRDSAWGDATVQQTLDMTTGVDYDENFADRSSGIFRYLIAAGLVPMPAGYDGPRTMPDLLKTIRKAGEHGEAFAYKTVDTEVIGWLLQRVTGTSYATLLSERIWAPIGAQEDGYVWVDGIGTALTSVGVSATLRDLARLGEMIRQDGRFNGRQVLRPMTIAQLRKGADPDKFRAAGMPARDGYSYHNFWWIAHDRNGSFEAKGLNGQQIHINPAADLVVVKLSSHPVPNTLFTHALDRGAFAAIARGVQARPSLARADR